MKDFKMEYKQLKKEVLELSEDKKKDLFVAILRGVKEFQRRYWIPDDICHECLANKTEGRCWACFEST